MSKVNLATFRINLVSQPVCSSKLMPLYDSRLFTEIAFLVIVLHMRKKIKHKLDTGEEEHINESCLTIMFPIAELSILG